MFTIGAIHHALGFCKPQTLCVLQKDQIDIRISDTIKHLQQERRKRIKNSKCDKIEKNKYTITLLNERLVTYFIELHAALNLSKHPYLVPPWRKQLRPPNSAEYVLMAEAMIVTALSTNDDDLEVFN